ncbi:MAG: DUF3793 family protein [Oscillospiraceae bacterium]|jgi:hypothetical protein|nr:DUF3793 family protein [Oscillospiraceae bacterium]
MQMSFEAALILYCSPALAGLKPANLFLYREVDTAQVKKEAAHWSSLLGPFGVAVKVLRSCGSEKTSLVYVYRKAQLESILAGQSTRVFLEKLGYVVGQGSALPLCQLSAKLCTARDFPHEIGIFLGYPLADVIAFVKNHGENCAYCGTWKSYGDPQAAKQYAARCSKCSRIYRERFRHGTPILQLVVAA